jgi:nicotinamidase-related amidase
MEPKNLSMKYLRPDHRNWRLEGKPALVLMHMQKGLAGEGMFIPNWGPHAAKGIAESGMVRKCRELADAFRYKKLPVVFVNAIPNPIRKVPAYGDLFREIEAAKLARPFFTDDFIRKGLEVMPEMGQVESDEVVYNWMIGSFTNSGLEMVLRKENVSTLILAGFAQQSVVYSTAVVAGDLWFNCVIPVDASYVCVPAVTPGYHDKLDDIVAEALVRVMGPSLTHMTDTADVIAHL